MLKDVLEVHQFSDFINRDTNRPFTFQNWKDFVEKLHEKKRGIAPPYRDVIERAHMMMNIQRKIPQALWRDSGGKCKNRGSRWTSNREWMYTSLGDA